MVLESSLRTAGGISQERHRQFPGLQQLAALRDRAVAVFMTWCDSMKCAFAGRASEGPHRQFPGSQQLAALGNRGRRFGAAVGEKAAPVTAKLQVTTQHTFISSSSQGVCCCVQYWHQPDKSVLQRLANVHCMHSSLLRWILLLGLSDLNEVPAVREILNRTAGCGRQH